MMSYGTALWYRRKRLCLEPKVGCRNTTNGTSQQQRGLFERFRSGGSLRRVGSSAILMGPGVKLGVGGGFWGCDA